MWPNPQETADLVTYTEEIFNGKLLFLCSDSIEVLKSASEKISLCICSILFFHGESDNSLPSLTSMANLRLDDISINLKMVEWSI